MLLAVSGPIGKIGGLLEKVFESGHARVAALMIEAEPRLLDEICLPKCLAEAFENCHGDLASYLSAIIDEKELSSIAQNWPDRKLGAARL